jgi:hypothetical protein
VKKWTERSRISKRGLFSKGWFIKLISKMSNAKIQISNE